MGVVDSIPLVLGLFFGMGVANMAFVIPSQTLFQERTPPELMGRVVSLRFALVFGGMSLAMALAGVAMTVVGPGPVIFAAGIVSVCAGRGGPVRACRAERVTAGPARKAVRAVENSAVLTAGRYALDSNSLGLQTRWTPR